MKSFRFFSLIFIILLFCSFAFTSPSIQNISNAIKSNSVYFDSLRIDSIGNLYKLYKDSVHASYYHNKFNGRRTASGTTLSNNDYTAAHKTLPFGTRVLVTNLVNNKSALVTITDRGPFIKGREIDLTKKVFMEIANNKSLGVLQVKLEILKRHY